MAERAASDVGGITYGSGTVLDDSGGDLECEKKQSCWYVMTIIILLSV